MIFAAIAPVFLIVLAGFLIRRIGLLSAHADATLLRICVNVLYPGLIAATVVGNPVLRQGVNVWMPPLVGFATVAIGYAIAYAGARLLRLPPGPDRQTFTYVTGLYNYGYMAIPVVEKLFGAKALAVLFTHNLGVEIGFWLGLSLIMASKAHQGGGGWWRKTLNAPVIAILLSLALNWISGDRPLPEWLGGTARMLGASAIPMALLLRTARSGAAVAAGASVLRLGLLPLGFLALVRWVPCSLELKQVLVVQAAMPCAMLPIVLAKHYGGNAGMAVQIVFATTFLALLTIPFWIHFGITLIGP